MEWPLRQAKNATEEINSARHRNIRLFSVPKRIAVAPVPLCQATWQMCTPETARTFSAVGYFFGRDLEMATGVPIGLIHSSWGGTVAEAWVSPAGLEPLGDFSSDLEQVRAMGAIPPEQAETEFWTKVEDWANANDPAAAAGEKWESADFKDDAWTEMAQPGQWEASGLNFDGILWMRRKVELSEAWDGKPGRLDLGVVDDAETAWVNGRKLDGIRQWRSRRIHDVPAGVLRGGRNFIAVRVVDAGGGGGFLPTPAGLQLLPHGESAGRQAVPLSGPWRYKAGKPLGERPPFPPRLAQNPNLVTVLSNGMIEPLVPFAIKGAIWYQGESNAARAEQYRKLLPALISDWRRRFRTGEFPFLIVQLANFRARDPQPLDKSEWAELREAQTLTARKVPRCGLALAIDIGEENDIHPANKQDVGKRLAIEARRVAFGERVESHGPAFQSMRIDGGKARIKFSHAGGGLVVKDGGTAAKGFSVAGRDGRWVWAAGEVAGEEVIVSSPEVPEPAAVRYAWASNPETNLYNKHGLPAEPFRTDGPQ
jgi:sialate O-acetylesterase